MVNQDDLTVAQAALRGDPVAVSAVLDELPYALGVLLSKCTDSDSEEKSREIIDDLPGDLLAGVDRDGKTIKLLEMYQGRASLRSWITVVALSRLKSWWRGPGYRKRERGVEPHQDQGTLSANGSDRPAEEPHNASDVLALLADALTDSLRSLTPRESVCLRLVYLHSVEQQRLARMLGCHAATISRDLDQTKLAIKRRLIWNLKLLDPFLEITWEDCVRLCASESISIFDSF
ncbi:MAG: sigma-70 family RNA polymerase sigma factor [Chthoniobacterales bacterium]